MVEFTGERVIPGQVNADLWSEHFARYAFASRFAKGQLVLDAGCGTGYGPAELAQVAAEVVGLDVSGDALDYARATYPLSNLTFTEGSCLAMPFPDASFDVVTSFELIEHLPDHARFIAECSRLVKTNGVCIVSTPNKRYYAESRAATGPNPYHVHEFEVEEFHDALRAAFDNVTLLFQNRVESFAFHPPKTFWPAEARVDGGAGSSEDAHFFVALCSHGALPAGRSFVYVPRAANVLREREQHIVLLEKQLDQTKAWLKDTERERHELLDLYRKQKDELEGNNRWAAQLNTDLEAARQRVEDLQHELATEQSSSQEVATGYEAKVQELDTENRLKTEWALETETRLSSELESRGSELAECARLLAESEGLVEERTHWARKLDAEKSELTARLNRMQSSRWWKLGRAVGLGPAGQ